MNQGVGERNTFAVFHTPCHRYFVSNANNRNGSAKRADQYQTTLKEAV